MNRAYAVLNWKSVDDDARTLKGMATTPSPDRMNDVIAPEGVEFRLPLPLLYQHQAGQPIGHVTAAKVTHDGIEVEAQVAPAGVAAFIDQAWNLIQAGLVRGLSIGFRSLEDSFDKKTGGMLFKRTEWLELSAVTIPANAEATITAIKSYDAGLPAALGHRHGVVTFNRPGVAGHSTRETTMRPIAEQIKDCDGQMAAAVAKRMAIIEKAGADNRTLDEAEAKEDDSLQGQIQSLKAHVDRLKTLEKDLIQKAAPVTADNTSDGRRAAETRSGAIVVKSALPPGTAFTRYAMALAATRGNVMQAVEYSKRWAHETPEVERVLRAAMAAGTTTDADWAAPLVEYQNIASEFVELLRPQTLLGNIPGLRKVPFNIKLPVQTQGSTVQWVGETAPKPVSELKFGQLTLAMYKAAGIVILSEELVRTSSPSAEALVRQDLTATIAQFLDRQFIDPAVAEVAGVSPASITNGVTPVPASGTTGDALRTDIKKLFNAFITANLSPQSGVWLMSPTQAVAISMIQNPLGQAEYPTINVNGGTLFGLPVVVSENIRDAATGSPPTKADRIILVSANDILLADEGGVMLDISREASVQMDSAPTNPPTATTVYVSLWQMNLVGIRAERFINWKRRRLEAVQYISDANYG
jgi:HK97 family phage major capsid protein/HK97 family phage prohead protease